MSGFRCFWQGDRVWKVLSALQRSVYSELILNLEFRTTAYRLGNRKIIVPRGHTLFSLAGLASAARVEKTLARKTIDRLEELGVLDKITRDTDLQLPECDEALIPVGISGLIPAEGTAAGTTPTVVRFRQAEAFLSAWRDQGKAEGTAVIGAEGTAMIPASIPADPKKRSEPAAIGPPSALSAGSALSATGGGAARGAAAPPPADPVLVALWGQLQRLRVEAVREASPDPGVGRGSQPARYRATLAALGELVASFGSPAELLEGYRSFLRDPWPGTLAPPYPLTAFAAQWARHVSPRSSAPAPAVRAEIMCSAHPDRWALNPLAERCGDCELERMRARA